MLPKIAFRRGWNRNCRLSILRAQAPFVGINGLIMQSSAFRDAEDDLDAGSRPPWAAFGTSGELSFLGGRSTAGCCGDGMMAANGYTSVTLVSTSTEWLGQRGGSIP